MPELSPDIEEELRNMSEADWAAFTARIRPPDLTEEFREIAAEIIPAHHLDEWMGYAKIDAFVTNDGSLDATRLRATLRTLFPATPSWDGQ